MDEDQRLFLGVAREAVTAKLLQKPDEVLVAASHRRFSRCARPALRTKSVGE
jgi:hypothetical protein